MKIWIINFFFELCSSCEKNIFNKQLHNCNFQHISDSFCSYIIPIFYTLNICNCFMSNRSQCPLNYCCIDNFFRCKMISHKNTCMMGPRSCKIPISSSFYMLSNQFLNSLSFRKAWRMRWKSILGCMMTYSCTCSWEASLRDKIKCSCCCSFMSKCLGKHIVYCCMSYSSLQDCTLCRNSLGKSRSIGCCKIRRCSLLSRLDYTCFVKGCSCSSWGLLSIDSCSCRLAF